MVVFKSAGNYEILGFRARIFPCIKKSTWIVKGDAASSFLGFD